MDAKNISALHVTVDPHALERAEERGASVERLKETVLSGEEMPAKKGRSRFVSNFGYNGEFQGRYYANQQLHVIAAATERGYHVVTVIVKYF